MKKLSVDFKDKKSILRLLYNVALYGFAIAGFLIIGAWAFYQLGFTKNSGGVDNNNRYLADVSKIQVSGQDSGVIDDKQMSENYIKLAAISKFYPKNAHLILQGISNSNGNVNLSQMLAATEIALKDNKEYQDFINRSKQLIASVNVKANSNSAIEWMNIPEWEALKVAIVKDKHLIDSC